MAYLRLVVLSQRQPAPGRPRRRGIAQTTIARSALFLIAKASKPPRRPPVADQSPAKTRGETDSSREYAIPANRGPPAQNTHSTYIRGSERAVSRQADVLLDRRHHGGAAAPEQDRAPPQRFIGAQQLGAAGKQLALLSVAPV